MTYEEIFEVFQHAVESNSLPKFAQWLMTHGHYREWKQLRDVVCENLVGPADIPTMQFLFPMNRAIGVKVQEERFGRWQ